MLSPFRSPAYVSRETSKRSSARVAACAHEGGRRLAEGALLSNLAGLAVPPSPPHLRPRLGRQVQRGERAADDQAVVLDERSSPALAGAPKNPRPQRTHVVSGNRYPAYLARGPVAAMRDRSRSACARHTVQPSASLTRTAFWKCRIASSLRPRTTARPPRCRSMAP